MPGLARAGDRAGTLEGVLRAALRRRALVLAAECALLGLAAGGFALAAALRSGAGAGEPGAWLAAGLAGLCCAASWWLERREGRARVARRVDRGTVGDGSFVTAIECERSEVQGALGTALVARTRGRVGPREARRAIAPPAVALVAAPLLALAVVAWLLEAERPAGGGPPPDPALARISVAVGAAVGEPGAEDPELGALLDEALRAAARPGRTGLEAALERLARGLEERLEPGPAGAPGGGAPAPADERARALERALELVRAAAPGGARARGAVPGEAAPGSGPGGLDGAGAGVTMSSSPEQDGGAETPGSPATAALPPDARNPEPGVLVGRTWDERYDGIVDAWLRRGAAGGGRDQDFE